ncbi:UNVERIFIED_CONTAM: hypothetical protein GTU68_026985, partial [Idotea baltica]|nr:hypothetical protein [Idotea baltica]
MLANSGQFEVSAIDLEEYFEDGLVNVSKELSSKLRLVYPKMCKGSSLDTFLERRLALKIQEERDFIKNK